MIPLAKRDTKLLIAIHGWSGIVLGLLLYAVVLTGTVAVLSHEIGIWSAGVTETRLALARPVDATLRRLAAQTPQAFHESVDLFDTTSHELGVFFHRHEGVVGELPVDRGVYYEVDADGRIVRRLEGTGEDVFGPDNDSALARFLVDTHVRLHVPEPWGLLLTGIVGLAMLVAAVSGLLIHRHLLTDAFTIRRRAQPVLAARDRHTVAGTWSLPFGFVLAFTGSFFSFAGSIGLPAIATVALGGDQMKLFEAVIGVEPAADPRPARAADIDRVLADARTRGGAMPDFVSVANLGRADANITVGLPPREGGLEPVTYVYKGATGVFERQKPLVGLEPSFGGALFALMGPLHFGSFAGLLSKAVWIGLGFATCFVTVSGIRLWLRRRPELGLLTRVTSTVVWGLPLALAISACGALLAMPTGGAVFWTPTAFLIAAAVAIVVGLFVRDAGWLTTALRGLTGASMLALPLLRHAIGEPGWVEAFAAGQPLLVGLDIAVALAGIAVLYPLIRHRREAGSGVIQAVATE